MYPVVDPHQYRPFRDVLFALCAESELAVVFEAVTITFKDYYYR